MNNLKSLLVAALLMLAACHPATPEKQPPIGVDSAVASGSSIAPPGVALDSVLVQDSTQIDSLLGRDVSNRPIPGDTGAIVLELIPVDSIPDAVQQHCFEICRDSKAALEASLNVKKQETLLAMGDDVMAMKMHGRFVFLKMDTKDKELYTGHGYTLRYHQLSMEDPSSDEMTYQTQVTITRGKEQKSFRVWGYVGC